MPRREPTHGGGPAYVQQLEGGAGFATIERETGTELARFDLVQEALDSLLSLPFFGDAVGAPILRDDSGETNGVFRWLDASATEPVAATDGSQVTAGGLRSMIDGLNHGEPVMVDGGGSAGGGAPSGAHESVGGDSSARANGWVHVGAEWRTAADNKKDPSRVHLALFCELHPDIARDVAIGRLAFGSIAFGQSMNDPDDARLWSHALTNMPAVSALVPAPAFRSQQGDVIYARSRTQRQQLMSKPVKKTAAESATLLLRAAGYDLKAIAESILSLPKDATCEQICAMCDASCKLQQAADPSLVAAPEVKADVPVDEKPADEKPVEEAARSVRAIEGFESTEAQDAWTSGVLTLLRAALGKAEASPAELKELLGASVELIKGAIANAGAGAAANQPDGMQAGSGNGDPAANAAKAAEADVARALEITREASTRAEVVRADAATARALIAEAEIERRDLSDKIVKRYAEAKLSLSDAERDELTGIVQRSAADDRDTIIDKLLGIKNRPPAGRAVATPTPASVQGNAGTRAVDAVDPNAALAKAMSDIEKEHPTMRRAERTRLAYERTRDAFVAELTDEETN